MNNPSPKVQHTSPSKQYKPTHGGYPGTIQAHARVGPGLGMLMGMTAVRRIEVTTPKVARILGGEG